ncbi:U-box domain-containing protein kinase family protein [Rhynchospora pubera]|uniref:RING-type E3 ubiquitin transferase n=1 Tax=Rhynchospora pubera TaxID=906938 RepID=A0AAV8EUP3_9POAL|nr:U-box domain-containing protein kinase family protein [Rhynchospora pubera]
MTLVSSPSTLPPLLQMEGAMSRASSVRSTSSSNSFNLGGIQEELEEIGENKVYAAVGKDVEEWRENLDWLLKNIDRNLLIVFLHVHQPKKRFKTPLGYMPANGIEQHKLKEYRELEKQEMDECLKKFIDLCTRRKFKAITSTIDNDDITKGLLELIKLHKVTDLIMGAGSERNLFFGRAKENKPPSKIAMTVSEKAEPSCRIRFINRGSLICIREPNQNAPDASNLSRSSSGSSSGNSMQLRSQSMPPSQAELIISPSGLDHRSRSVNVAAGASLLNYGSPHNSYHSGLETLYAGSSSNSSQQNMISEVDNCSPMSSLPEIHLNNSPPSFHNVTEDFYTRLMEAMEEAEKLKREAYEQSNRRRKAEVDLLQANRQLNAQHNELERHKNMYEQAQKDLLSLESQTMQLSQKVTELQTKLEETSALLEKTTRERDLILREAQELNRPGGSRSRHLEYCTVFTYSEIAEATRNFDPLNKIGEGGFGAVYKGFLRHTTVAMKILNRDSLQGDPQFYQEIEILTRIRHPHLVTLIGACLEARVLVYEYLPLGSLDKHLTCKDRNRSLPWQTRVQVACEICSALIFLHSSKVVHGDLKPENVLLDSNFVVKLSDLGICRRVYTTNTTSTPYHLTEQPRGTFPYMDPEYLSSGELTPHYDVYSFGIVLLQLVTGKEAKKLKSEIEDAKERGQLDKIVDQSAGWPPEQARRMIHIGLRCSDASRKNRPDLVKDVWGWLESISNIASASLRRSFTRATG